MRFTITLLALALLCFGTVLAQSYSDHPSVTEEGFQRFSILRNSALVPPSPEAAALSVRADADVSHYTGTLNYTLPIEAIRGSKLNMNFGLHYSGTAKKVSEAAGWVGLGWTLQGGGVISRTARGAPDLGFNYYDRGEDIDRLTADENIEDEIARYGLLYDTKRGYLETQPDLYQINFPGGSGSFIITHNKVVVNRASESFEVTPKWGNDGRLNGFTVRDEAGVVYLFDKVETTRIKVNTEVNKGAQVGVSQYVYNSAWYLSDVRSYDGRESIRLAYHTAPDPYDIFYGNATSTTYSYQMNSVFSNSTGQFCGGSSPDFCGPKTILTASGGGAYSQVYVTNRRWLKDVTLLKGSLPIQKIAFTSSERLKDGRIKERKLNEIVYDPGALGSDLTHKLSYNETTNRLTLAAYQSPYHPTSKGYQFTYFRSLPSDFKSTAIDHWGYYKSGGGNSIVPSYLHSNGTLYPGDGADRNTDPTRIRSGLLTDIALPTGGRLNFIYESHRVANWDGNFSHGSYTEIPGGGVRIAEIKRYSNGSNLAQTRKFTYTLSNSTKSSGLLFTKPKYHRLSQTETYGPAFGHPADEEGGVESCDPPNYYICSRMTIQSQSIVPLRVAQGSYVGYSRVVESNAGKTLYTFQNEGFSDLDFDKPRNGKLLTHKSYEKSGRILTSRELTYGEARPKTTIGKEVHIDPLPKQDNKTQLSEFKNSLGYGFLSKWDDKSFVIRYKEYVTKFRVRKKSLHADSYVPISEKVTEYFYPPTGERQAIVKNRKFKYRDPEVLKPTEVSFTNSDGKVHYNRTYYAHTPGNPTDNLQKIRNIGLIGVPLATDFLVGQSAGSTPQLRYRSKVRYRSVKLPNNKGTYLYLTEVYDGFNSHTPSLREEVKGIDQFGNVIQTRMTHDISTSYIYDRYGTTVTAKVRGATPGQCAFTSFEGKDDLGGWTIADVSGKGPAFTSSRAKAGRWSANQNVLSKANLPAGRYILSYWTTAANYVTSRGSMSTIRTTRSAADREGYIFVEKLISVRSNGKVEVVIKGGNTDEVRLYPANAMMQTFTIDPGYRRLSAMGDASGRLQRFSYDQYHRLHSIKDYEGCLVSQHDYSYEIDGQRGLNAVTTLRPLVWGLTSSAAQNTNNADKQISYVDGLGRPIQAVNVQGAYSPTGKAKDIVQFTAYDKYGRQVKEYLPLVAKTNNGSYREGVLQQQQDFYANTYGTANSQTSFKSIGLLTAPIGRLTSIREPGAALHSHPNTFSYRTNKRSEVRRFDQRYKFYGTGELLVTTTVDSDGRKSSTYTDKSGRLVRKDQHTSKTYYIYDDFGQPKYIITPEGAAYGHASSARTISTPGVRNNAYIKSYNGKTNLLQRSWAPGQEATSYFYDRLERLVLTKLPTGKNTFYKYDLQGRNVMTGTYSGTQNPSDSDALYEVRTGSNDYKYSTNRAFPKSNLKIYHVQYYDDYDFNGDGTSDAANAYVVPPISQRQYYNNGMGRRSGFTRGMQTGERTSVIDANNFIGVAPYRSIMHYDSRGRLIQLNKSNFLSRKDVHWFQYDFAGNLLRTRRQHTAKPSAGNSESIVVNQMYTYDRHRHLTKTYHQIEDTGPFVQLSEREYDDRGQLAIKQVGRNTATTTIFAQTLRYQYNMQGWLTKINDVGDGKSGNDLFSMTLSYYNPTSNSGAQPQYGGGISEQRWKYPGQGNDTHSYAYAYDELSRLKSADYSKIINQRNRDVNRFSVDNLSYDFNGNLKSIRRRGQLPSGDYGIIDDLSFTYDRASGRNDRLLRVAESADAATGYLDLDDNNLPVTYDELGNVLRQPNKGIQRIDYNIFNLPRKIHHTSGVHLMAYDGLGNKVVAVDPTNNDRTDYVDGLEIVNGKIHSISHEEGRVVREGSKWIYEYTIKDHLGNTRVLFRDDNGTPKVVSTYSYYPFGMQNDGLSAGTEGDLAFKYRYNGKELNQDLGLYDYGARNYDPAIGRWLQIDPLAETMPGWSGYNYVYNNPISLIDPLGLSPYKYNWKTGAYENENGTEVTWETVQGNLDTEQGTSEDMAILFKENTPEVSTVPFTDEALAETIETYWGSKPDHVTSIERATKDNLPEGYSIDDKGYLLKPNGELSGGVTVPVDGSGSTMSKIYISKLAFRSKSQLALNIGHEIFHSNLFKAGIHDSERHHAVISEWQKMAGQVVGYDNYFKGTAYPKSLVEKDFDHAPQIIYGL